MKHTREYEIAWQGLKPGLSVYVYDIDDRFMEEKEADKSYKNWNAKVTLQFDKHESFFILDFDVDGLVSLPCDRCGDEFDLKLWDEFKLIIKLIGDDASKIEEEDDVVFISRSDTVIDISGWIYEYVMLSIPIQCIHPDLENGDSGCNEQVIKLLNNLYNKEEPAKKNQWKGLDKIKIGKKK